MKKKKNILNSKNMENTENQRKPKKHRLKRFFKFIFKPFKSKKFWVVFNIVMSYIMMYGAPIIILFIYTQDKFFREKLVGMRFSLQFIGFVVVTLVLMALLIFKLTIKMIKSKPSIFKYIFIMLVWLAVLSLPIYLIYKLYEFTFIIESNTESFFNAMRVFISKVKNSLYVFGGCVVVSTAFKISALAIDKEYVHELDWL